MLRDIEVLSEENGLEDSVIKTTSTLKRKINETYSDEISFFPKGKFLLVHSSDMNPCEYSVATLHGYGLRDDDLARSFGKMIRRKIHKKKVADLLPKDSRTLEERINTGPLPELYNAIIYSLYESHPSKNSNGYASAS